MLVEIPAGLLVTVPEPFPALLTVMSEVVELKVADTFLAALIETTQVPEPLQSPPQPKKVCPGVGVAVSATSVPLA